MGTVLLDISMSLDGFVTGPHDSIEQPLGIGGERLHEWIFGALEKAQAAAGDKHVIVGGARTPRSSA